MMAKSKEKKSRNEVDGLLHALTTTARDEGIEFRITLDVRGALVSGVLIGEHAWLEAWRQQVSQGWRDELADTYSAASEGKPARSVTFIHLRDAQYWNGPQALPTNTTFLWRGRLGEVSGWAEGSLSNDAAS
jgi:hypothetical protein